MEPKTAGVLCRSEGDDPSVGSIRRRTGENESGTRQTKIPGAPARGYGRKIISQPRLLMVVALGDLALVAGIGLAVSTATGAASAIGWTTAALIVAGVSCAVLAVLQKLWCYTVAGLARFARQFGRISLGLACVFSAAFAIAFMAGSADPAIRSWLIGWFALSWAMLAGTRLVYGTLIAHWTRNGRLQRRTVIVGGGNEARDLVERLTASAPGGVSILGIFDDRDEERSPEDVSGIRKLGCFTDLVAFCRSENVDLLIVNLPAVAERRILGLLRKLWVLPIDIRLSALNAQLRFQPRAYTYIGDVPMFAVFDKPLSDWSRVVKMLEDRLLGALLLVLAAPLMALVAIAVKLDSKGPVFFRQKRYGFNNRLIEVLKFRSMYTDMSDADAAKLVTRDDPRVTPVGRFIRKTSLDELPQLYNVVAGQLSLVGPRPHALQAKSENRLYEQVVNDYFARHRIKPGITGWAQINGWRGETDTAEKIERRVEHDLYYIDHWSLALDLYIIALTPFALLRGENAY